MREFFVVREGNLLDKWMDGRWLRRSLLILSILASCFLLMQLRGVLQWVWDLVMAVSTPFLIAMVISYLLNPVVNVLARRGMPRTASVVLIFAIFVVLIILFAIHITPLIINQLKEFALALPRIVQKVDGWVDGMTHNTKYLPDTVRRGVEANLKSMEQRISASIADFLTFVGNTVEQMLTAFVIPFLVFYMLKDLKMIERTVISCVPRERRVEVKRVIREIDEALGSYIRGQLLVMLMVGIFTYAGYLVIGIPYPLLLAILVAVTNIIPYLGPFIGAIPALFIGLTVSPAMMLKALVVNLIVQQIEGNVISPQIVGKSLNVHPVVIIFALLLGGELAGMKGLILAIPAVAVIKVLLEHWVRRKRV
jgi:predicted PurR-regulated permease PerM